VKKALAKRGRIKVTVKITFTPTAGAPATQTTRVTLKLRKRR
jgi:hypothetical protein